MRRLAAKALRGRLAGTVLVGLVALLVAAQIVVPLYLSRRVEVALERGLNVSGLEVKVRVFPFIKLLTGGIDAILVEGENLAAGDLNVDRLDAAITSLKMDVTSLWRSGTLAWDDPGMARLRVEVSEQSLSRFLQSHFGPGVTVTVTRDRVQVVIAVPVRGEQMPVTVSGVPVLSGGGLSFQVQDVAVAGEAVPPRVREVALRLAGFPNASLDFGELPWPIKPEEVKLEDGRVVLVAGGR